MSSVLIRNARLVNEGREFDGDLLVSNGRIVKIARSIEGENAKVEIDAKGQWLLPGMIDDQVHFREPGAPAKGSIHTESRAAVAGGITSFMDMPNTTPATLTLEALADKKRRAAINSVANYGFHFGVSQDNLDTVAALNPCEVAGVKVFMGASTGNMLVDDPKILLAHCEHTPSINANAANLHELFGDRLPPAAHALIRNAVTCYRSSSMAVDLAKRHGTRLHVLHLTTAREVALFEDKPLAQKHITAEVCLHHLLFDDRDYPHLGNLIKCNPAIKTQSDRDALRAALNSNRLDVIGSDHAPHTWAEKQRPYAQAPAGLPLVQHALPALLELVADDVLPITTLVAKTSHRVADLFAIPDRGYLREGYWADLVLVEAQTLEVDRQPILSQCGWTPFAGRSFRHRVNATMVSGQIAWREGRVNEGCRGLALRFMR
ncbi:dihydroorotase [Pseudomonas sp. H3_C08]